MADQVTDDLATILASEFGIWFKKLAEQGVLCSAFTGVKEDGKQALVILAHLPFENARKRDFLIWLCQHERFFAYAYGLHVGIAADSSSTITEAIDIYASSDFYDASKTFAITWLSDRRCELVEEHSAIMPTNPKNGLFFCLQRTMTFISSDDQNTFFQVWKDMQRNKNIGWRQR